MRAEEYAPATFEAQASSPSSPPGERADLASLRLIETLVAHDLDMALSHRAAESMQLRDALSDSGSRSSEPPDSPSEGDATVADDTIGSLRLILETTMSQISACIQEASRESRLMRGIASVQPPEREGHAQKRGHFALGKALQGGDGAEMRDQKVNDASDEESELSAEPVRPSFCAI